jgi:hypothetical protein
MSIALNILLTLVLALVVTLLVVLILARQPSLRQGLGFYSPMIFLLIAAVGLWSQSTGMASGPGGWIGAVVTGLIVLLTALALRPRPPSLRLLTSRGDAEAGPV